jgi:hypothetical protein
VPVRERRQRPDRAAADAEAPVGIAVGEAVVGTAVASADVNAVDRDVNAARWAVNAADPNAATGDG